ncbi:MAG TPA: hypothetical protein VI248_00245 [Kineosporiaceae bacterium]
MSGHGRPSVDVHAVLEAPEWRELFGEALRLSGFWARTALAAATVVLITAAALVLGAAGPAALAIGTTAVSALATYATAYALVGPRLRWPRIAADQLTVHWRVQADRIEADRAGTRFELDWNDVDQVVVTRRLVLLRLGDHGGVLGLPRRVATPLGESLITTWAEDSGAEVVRRRQGR